MKINIDDLTSDLTDKELREIEAASQMPIEFDLDSPEMTAKMLEQFKKMNHQEPPKQVIPSIQLSKAL